MGDAITKEQQLSDVEKLLILKAMRDVIGNELDTNKDNLRGKVDKSYKKEWERTGGKSFDMRVRGKKVATYSISTSKEKTRTVFDLIDEGYLAAWLDSRDGVCACKAYADQNIEKFVEWYVKTTGDIPDGVEPREITVSKDGDYKGGRISRFNQGVMLEALGSDMPTVITGLLGGSNA